jgi:hypothetical protein
MNCFAWKLRLVMLRHGEAWQPLPSFDVPPVDAKLDAQQTSDHAGLTWAGYVSDHRLAVSHTRSTRERLP